MFSSSVVPMNTDFLSTCICNPLPLKMLCTLRGIRNDLLLKEVWASLVVWTVKNPPPIWETQVQHLGRENTLEKGIVTHSRVLARKITWTEEPSGLQVGGVAESDMNEHIRMHTTSNFTILTSSFISLLYHI